MRKKFSLKSFLLLVFLLLCFSIPVFAEYIAGRITNVNLTRIGDIVYIEGETTGFTSKMTILIKVLDDNGNLQYFNEVPVDYNGEFYDHFVPMDVNGDTYLNFNFSGDLAYSCKLFYSNEFSSSEEALEVTLLRYLQDYKYYKDSTSKYAMNFIFSYEHGINKGNVVLTGTNFSKEDTLFSNRDKNYWISYLSTIKNLSQSIASKEITILVYDKNNNLVFTYPEIIGGSNNSENNSGNDGNNGDVDTGGDGGNFDQGNGADINDIIPLLGQKVSFNSNGQLLEFAPVVSNNSNSGYIKVNFKGNFSRNDEIWRNASLIDLEEFSRTLANKIKAKYTCDIDFDFLDNDNKILNSYSYYFKNQDVNNPGEEAGGEDSGEEVNPTITPIPTQTPTINPSITDSENTSGTTDEISSYKPWNPFDNLGVYTLNLMIHSYNSTVLEAPLISEGYEGAVYKYNYLLSDYNSVESAINSLRNDSKKVLVVRANTLGSNITFTIPAHIVDLLKANKVTFIFDSSYLKVESDFGACNYSGDYTISTNETIAMLTNRASDAYNINVTLGGMDAFNLFANKIKVALHYTYESAANVSDLRFVTNYYNGNMILNTTVNENLKAFISTYNGGGIYCAKENRIIFNDSNFNDSSYKRYAEIVVSRGLMDGSGGIFNPKFTMTRGEFVNAVAKKMGVSSSINYFSDLLGGNPYFYAFNGAYEYGLLPSSWRNGSQVDKKITIEEMIYIIVRCYEVNSLNSSSYGSALYYKDVEDISAWAKNKVAIAAKLGLIPTDGYLYPTENGTREDAVELLFKLMDVEGSF